MARIIRWSKYSDEKLDSIVDYLLNNWGERSVKIFLKKIYETIELIKEFPEIGSLEYAAKNIRGIKIVKQITLFYKVTDHAIIILNFYDNRQNPKKNKYGKSL